MSQCLWTIIFSEIWLGVRGNRLTDINYIRKFNCMSLILWQHNIVAGITSLYLCFRVISSATVILLRIVRLLIYLIGRVGSGYWINSHQPGLVLMFGVVLWLSWCFDLSIYRKYTIRTLFDYTITVHSSNRVQIKLFYRDHAEYFSLLKEVFWEGRISRYEQIFNVNSWDIYIHTYAITEILIRLHGNSSHFLKWILRLNVHSGKLFWYHSIGCTFPKKRCSHKTHCPLNLWDVNARYEVKKKKKLIMARSLLFIHCPSYSHQYLMFKCYLQLLHRCNPLETREQ